MDTLSPLSTVQARSLVANPSRVAASPLRACLRLRPSGAVLDETVLPCSTAIGNLPSPFRKQGMGSSCSLYPEFSALAFYQRVLRAALRMSSLANADSKFLPLFSSGSAITPPLSFQQSLVPAVPQKEAVMNHRRSQIFRSRCILTDPSAISCTGSPPPIGGWSTEMSGTLIEIGCRIATSFHQRKPLGHRLQRLPL